MDVFCVGVLITYLILYSLGQKLYFLMANVCYEQLKSFWGTFILLDFSKSLS